jgi:hypothetical protein
MAKNMIRKSLAVAASVALGMTGVVGLSAPANAADGDVISIAPTTGSGYGAYNTDFFNVDVTIDTDVVTSTAYSKLALQIDAADSADVSLKLTDGVPQGTISGTTCTFALPVTYYTSLGVKATVNATATAPEDTGDGSTGTAAACGDLAAKDATFTIDMTQSSVKYITAVVDLTSVLGTTDLTASLKADDGATASDHKNRTVGFSAFLDSDEDELKEASDLYKSTVETLTFYDAANVNVTPRIERFIIVDGTPVLNEASGQLGGSLQFSPQLNLDQINLSNLTISSDDADIAVFVPQRLINTTSHSAAGRIYGLFADAAGTVGGGNNALDYTTYGTAPTAAAIAVATSVNISVAVANANAAGTGPKTTTSPGFTIPRQATAGITAVAGALVSETSDVIQSSKTDVAIEGRTGATTMTFVAEGTFASGAVAGNVPVIAQVTANILGKGESITVAGRSLSDDASILIQGVTNSSGKYTLPVVASSAKAGEQFTVDFYMLLNNGTWANNINPFVVTYEAAVADAIDQTSAILGGATVTASYTIEDQFGEPISTNATGDQYVIKVTASNVTDLEQYLPVVDGAAEVTFTNYLAVGLSDGITATVGKGATKATWASQSLTTTSSVSATLYNSEAASGITVAAPAAGVVIYEDFITGTPNAVTNPAPTSSVGTSLSGTVVTTTGVGIPGAVITVSADGVQFAKASGGTPSGKYFLDTITVVADAAGSFEVKMWTHVANATGTKVTVTGAGITETVTWKTYLPGNGTNNLTGAQLVFSWNVPAVIVKDTTYRLTAKLADVWGNPVPTKVNGGVNGVSFQGLGSVTVNSLSTAVDKNFDKNGEATVFIRSVKDVAGPGSITATLGAANYDALSTPTATALTVAAIATNAAGTSWNETLFDPALEVDVEVLETAPAASATGKVNVGSFNGKLVVYAAGLDGAKISWKVAGRWGTAVASGNYDIFDRPVGAAGRNVNVEIYVNGVKQLTKTVLTR